MEQGWIGWNRVGLDGTGLDWMKQGTIELSRVVFDEAGLDYME